MSLNPAPVAQADRRIPKGGDYLTPTALGELTPAGLTKRIRALQPLIARHACEAEALRRPVDEVWQSLRDAGFFYQFIPKKFGGLESDFDSFIDAGMAIGEVDASTAWTATFCAEHNWVVSHFPVATHEALWGGDFPYIVAPLVSFPPGAAVPVSGGFRVTAHWKWGTGVMHANWIMGNALVQRNGSPPEPIMVLFPASKAEVLDTWRMTGMSGTGSNDIVVKDLFVPADYTVANVFRGGRSTTERNYANPIYGAPLLPFLAMSASIPAAGAVRGMVNMYRARVASAARPGSDGRLADKVAAQIRLARADLLARSAEILIRDAGHRMLKVADLKEPDQTNERLALRAQLSMAVCNCRDAAMVLVEGAGSSVHALDQPFQRAMRDILVVSTHVAFDCDIAYEQHGRGMVGLPPNTPLT
jgi:alkylation response protein AidB-like acyl-CoA dehydrogenase